MNKEENEYSPDLSYNYNLNTDLNAQTFPEPEKEAEKVYVYTHTDGEEYCIPVKYHQESLAAGKDCIAIMGEKLIMVSKDEFELLKQANLKSVKLSRADKRKLERQKNKKK